MKAFGIMTLYDQIPYKKPILKQAPSAHVNARGVIRELEEKYGGLYHTK